MNAAERLSQLLLLPGLALPPSCQHTDAAMPGPEAYQKLRERRGAVGALDTADDECVCLTAPFLPPMTITTEPLTESAGETIS